MCDPFGKLKGSSFRFLHTYLIESSTVHDPPRRAMLKLVGASACSYYNSIFGDSAVVLGGRLDSTLA
jgi:hypothetical protein